MTTIEFLQAIMPAMMAAGIDLNPVAKAVEELSLAGTPQPPVAGEVVTKAVAFMRHDGLCAIVGGYDYCSCGMDEARTAIRSLSPSDARGGEG